MDRSQAVGIPLSLQRPHKHFGRPVPEISMISNTVIDFIFEHHSRRLSEWNHTILNHHALQTYAEAVSDKGAALDNCFGFVDGTVRPICRPNTNKRIVTMGTIGCMP